MHSLASTLEHVDPGCVVEYLHSGQPLLGWIVEAQPSRVRLININKREMKLPHSRLLPWPGPCYQPDASRQDMLDILERHAVRRETLAEQVQPLEIWELAQGELSQATADWFAHLLWSDPDVDHIAAMGRALLRAKTHFKFSPPSFEVYPEETVQARLDMQEANRRTELLVGHGTAFFKALWDRYTKGGGKSLPELPDEVAAELRELLLTRISEPEDRESEKVWKQLRRGLPEDPHLALHLAQAWGLLSPHHNYLLDRADYDFEPGWAAAYQDEIASIRDRFESDRTPPLDLPLVSIDSATTLDIDDAFHVRAASGGGYTLTLALACPVLHWPFGSGLDQAVAHRATSLYLPEGTSHMLPESLGIDLYSLLAGQDRPALLLQADFDAQGELLHAAFSRSWVRVARNRTYEQVEEELNGPAPEEGIALAMELARKLRAVRIQRGAVVIDQPDPAIELEERGGATRVKILDKPDTPLSAMLVSEFMIFANTFAATWACEQDIPMLFRTQAIALSKSSAGVWTAPQDIYKIVREMSSTCLEPRPRPHASLAAQAYTPVTSPLRRYTDFVNVAQIVRVLDTGAPRWNRDHLETMASSLSARMELVGQVQRFRPRYWKLVHFKQRHKEQTWSGVVVDESGNLVTLALPREQILLRAPRRLFGDKLYPGQRFSVRLAGIDPLNNEIKIVEAWEE